MSTPKDFPSFNDQEPSDSMSLDTLKVLSIPTYAQKPFLNFTSSVTPEEVLIITQQYFDYCASYQLEPTSSGLALAFNVSQRELRDLIRSNSPIGRAFQRAILTISDKVERNLITGKSPVGLIFWLKNLMEWEDKTEVVSSKRTMGEYLRHIRNNATTSTTEVIDGTTV